MSDLQFEFFDRFTPSYADSRLKFARDDLEKGNPVSIVDVGCGDGSVLRFLADNRGFERVVGIDPSPAYVDKAKLAGVGSFVVGSILDPAVVDQHQGRYDRVVMASVLHHLVGPTRAASKRIAEEGFRNAFALVAPGGSLYLFEPLHGPRLSTWIAFWAKMLVCRIVGNRRVELGVSWLNFGAPVVSYLTDKEVRAFIERTGGLLRAVTVISSKRLFGPLLWVQQTGYIIDRTALPKEGGAGVVV